MVTSRDLADIAARAMTLQERIEAFRASGASGPAAAPEDLLAAWMRSAAAGDADAFRRRLSWDDLAPDDVIAAVATPVVFADRSLPAWTSLLVSALSRCEGVAAEVSAGTGPRELAGVTSGSASRFPELWVPFVRSAGELVSERAGPALALATPEALDSLEGALLRQMGAVGELAVYERFDLDRRQGAVYRDFILSQLRGGLVPLCVEFPVLARQLCRLADTWADSSAELLRRVEQDRALLRERFGAAGALCEIETGLSDRHAGGRTVARLRFAEGPNIVYKPRSVAIEAAWSALLSWLSENGGEPPPAPRVLERAGYGFVEFLEPCELAGAREARDYFRKAGALLCLAWVAGLDDLHRENVIATRGGPALIDTETALQPQFASESGPGSGAMARAAGRWNRSFLRSGLLTTLKLDTAGRPVEIGGLRGRGGHPIAAKARRFSSPNTDAMELVWETAAAAATRNLPTLGGDPLFPDDFSEEAVDGFSSMYRFLLERREAVAAPGGPLDPFAGAECRLVVRPSAVYAGLLLELSAPGFLRDGLTRSFAIDSLSRIFRFERERPALWLLTRQEQGALERLDLPRFSVDPASRSIRAGTDEEIGGRIARSGLEAARDRLALLCPEDLAAQRALLEDELSAASASGQVGRPRTGRRPAGFSGRSFRRTAEDIGEEIRSQASEQAGGALTWKTPAAEGERGGEPGVAHGLYAGASGIVVFFAALGAVSGSRKPFGIARAAALPIAAALDSSPPPHAGPAELIGACNGLGSLVYALVTAGKLASDPWYFEVAARAASRITRETIDGDNELDVESGAAGAILGLLALETVAPDSGALERAVLCGEHLLSLRREMGDGLWGWPSRGGLCLAGFAHGAAGIALALGRLSRPAGRPDFGRAALSACRYESTLYDPGHENWPVLSAKRPGQERIVMTAWCHGAPGIAISRAGLSGALGEGEVASDLARALAATRKAGPLGTDHLCCGNAGLVEALLVCGETFARTDWIDEAQSRASVLLQGAIERGGFRFRLEDPGPPSEPDPGFFRGLAGVGYTLLRVAVPATLPSVLCFADAAGFRPPA